MYWFRRKWYQIKRVVDFLPIIWKGFDFDYRYALDLFKHQLERQARFMESDKAHTLEAKQTAREIRKFLCLFEKVYKEEYATEYIDKMEELYGKWHMDFEPIEVDGVTMYEAKDWYEREDGTTEETKTRLMKESRDKQEKAHRILWEYFAHKVRGWWD